MHGLASAGRDQQRARADAEAVMRSGSRVGSTEGVWFKKFCAAKVKGSKRFEKVQKGSKRLRKIWAAKFKKFKVSKRFEKF